MEIIATILIVFVAAEHLFFLYFEMFAWETIGMKLFRGLLPKELFKQTKVLAANQGLYNGFLVAGLVWSLLIKDSEWSTNVSIFFLTCVIVAGTYAGLTSSRKILLFQAFPAILALIFVLLSR
jgi:putative membrane protein